VWQTFQSQRVGDVIAGHRHGLLARAPVMRWTPAVVVSAGDSVAHPGRDGRQAPQCVWGCRRLTGFVGGSRYHRPDMKIAYLFLPVYFGLFAGFVGHSVQVGLAGAAVGLFLAVWLARERRPDTGMAAIDAMTGTEFEDYVAARMQRAGWRITFTPASGDYGVDLIARRDDKSVAVQCKRLGKPVGIGAVQQVVSGARHHDCTKSIVVSNQEFTDAAKRLAYTHNCQLIGRRALQAWVPPPARRVV
jgi:restriction system protein